MTAPNPKAVSEAVERIKAVAEAVEAARVAMTCDDQWPFVSIKRADLETLLAALAAKDEALKPLSDAAKVTPYMIGRGDQTRPYTPRDDEYLPAGHITWGMVRAASSAIGDQNG